MATTYTVVVTRLQDGNVVATEYSYKNDYQARAFYNGVQEREGGSLLSVDAYETETKPWFPGLD